MTMPLAGRAKSFFIPTLGKIAILSTLSFLSLPAYVSAGSYYFPAYWILYPLVVAYNSLQPLIARLVVSGYLEGVNYFELFYTWILPSASVVFFYVVGCTIMWISKYGKERGKQLTPIALVTIFLVGLFALPPFVVPLIAQAVGPPPPKYVTIVLHDKESCESLPFVVQENGGDLSTFSVSWKESCIFTGTVEIPNAYFSLIVEKEASLTIRGQASTIRSDLQNRGAIVIDSGSSFILYGISNDGIIHVKKGAVLDSVGMISSQSGVDNDRGEIMPGDPTKIQIINKGTFNNKGSIENFGAIKNEGTLNNEGELALFVNTSFSNTNGGHVENDNNGKILIGANSTLFNSGSISNFGQIHNSGTIRNPNHAVIENQGYGVISNNGIIYNDATIANLDIGQIINEWMIYNGCDGSIVGVVSGQQHVDACLTP